MMSVFKDDKLQYDGDSRDHVQYLTVSKSYSDNCTCSLAEQNTTLKNL